VIDPVFADDLILDVPYEAGSHHVSDEEIIDFARRWDPLPMHTDLAAAAASPFGGLIASGIHSFGIYQRLTVLNVYRGWQIIAGRRIHELEFPKPVFAGTTLRAFVRIDRIVPRGDGRSVVHKTGTLVDDEGDLVFRIHPQVYMWDRTSLLGST
jgi:acyl dehydratase